MSSQQAQSLTYPVAQRKMPRLEGTTGSMAPADHSPESRHRFPNNHALQYSGVGGAYYTFDTIVQDGLNLPPPWSPSNSALLNGRNPMINSPKGPLRHHIAYRPENLPFSVEGNQASMAQELQTKQGFTYYSRSPGMRGSTDPGAASPVGVRKHTAGSTSLSPRSGNSLCLAVPKPVYGHSPCCSELGCSAGHRYNVEHGPQRTDPSIYQDDWVLHDRRVHLQGKDSEVFMEQRATQLDHSAERQPPRAVEEYFSSSPNAKSTFIEPNYSTYPCATSRSLVVPSTEACQRLQISPKAFHGLYTSHPPTYKHMTSLHHGVQSQLYHDHTRMSKYGQLTQQPVFYYSQANVEVESRATYKDVAEKHREDVDPSVHRHTSPSPTGHYLVSQPTFSDVPILGPMAPPNDSFLRGFEHSSHPIYRMHLMTGQMLERQTMGRPCAPPHSLRMDQPCAPPHRLRMDQPCAPPHSLRMDQPCVPPHSLHMDQPFAPPHSLHMDLPSATPHGLHMDLPSAPPQGLHMDWPSAPSQSLHMKRPSGSPHGLRMKRPSGPPHSLYMQQSSNPPTSPQSDRPLDYSQYRAPVQSPIQLQGHPEAQRASLTKQKPAALGSHMQTSPKYTTDPLRITGSPIVGSKGYHVPASNVHVTDCKSLKRCLSNRPLNNQSTSLTYKEDSRDAVDIDHLPKKRRKIEADPERAGSCPPLKSPSPSMPVICGVFSLAPYRAYLEAAGMLPPPSAIQQATEPFTVKAEPRMQARGIRQNGEKPVVHSSSTEKPLVCPHTPKEKPVMKMLELRKIKMEPQDTDSPLKAHDCCFKVNSTGVKEEMEEKDSSKDGLMLVIKKCEPDEFESRPLKSAKDESLFECNAETLPAHRRVRSGTPSNTPQPCEWTLSSYPKSVTPPRLPASRPDLQHIPPQSLPVSKPALQNIIPKSLPMREPDLQKILPQSLPVSKPDLQKILPQSLPVSKPDFQNILSQILPVSKPDLQKTLPQSLPVIKPDPQKILSQSLPEGKHGLQNILPQSLPVSILGLEKVLPQSLPVSKPDIQKILPQSLPVRKPDLQNIPPQSLPMCKPDPPKIPPQSLPVCKLDLPKIPPQSLPVYKPDLPKIPPQSIPVCKADLPKFPPQSLPVHKHDLQNIPPQILPVCKPDLPKIPPRSLAVRKPDLLKIPPQSLKLSTYKIVLPDLLQASPSSPLPPEKPQPPAEAEVEPVAGVPRQARQHFMELHHVLCRLLSRTVSQSPEQEIRSWLSKLELPGPPSPSTKAQNVSGLLGAKVRDMWLNDEIVTALQKVQQRLWEYIGQHHSPFPYVTRAGAMFIPMLVVKEILFPQVQGPFIDQVLQEHKVELRPTTLSEEKILTQLHKRACSSKLRRLLSLKHLPEIYLDVLNLFYHSCVCKRLGVKLNGSTRKGQENGSEKVDGSRNLQCSQMATSSTPNQDSKKRLKDMERGLHYKKRKRKSRKMRSSKQEILERSTLSEGEEYTEQGGNWSIVNTFDEEHWDSGPLSSSEDGGSVHTAVEEPKESWMRPLTSDELSPSSNSETERVSNSSCKRRTSGKSRGHHRPTHLGMILKLRRVLIDTGRSGSGEHYQALSNSEGHHQPLLSEAEDGGRGQATDGEATERGLSRRTSSPAPRREQRATSSSCTLSPICPTSRKVLRRSSLVKIKYCPYLSACHSAEHRRRWVLRSAVQRARQAMKMYYPDLVGKRIRHLYEEIDKTEVWYRGLVVRVHEQHPNPLKTVFEVQYDSEPEWQYYLELLIDYKKGWLRIDD